MASTSREHWSYSLIGKERQRIEAPGNYDRNSMGHNLDKFLLLMWKNWLLQYRKPVQTLVEILAPVLFSFLLVVIRSLVDPTKNDPKLYSPFDLLPLSGGNNNTSEGIPPYLNLSILGNLSLAYSPATNEALRRSMNIFNDVFDKVIGYNNSAQLEAHFGGQEGLFTFAGIQLNDILANQRTLPDDLEVTIRFPSELRSITSLFGDNNWHTNLLYPIYQTPGPRSPNNNTGAVPDKLRDLFKKRTWKTNKIFPIYQSPGPRSPHSKIGSEPGYFAEGFLTLQLVTTYILAFGGYQNVSTFTEFVQKMLENVPPVIRMQRFPYASWIEDPLLQALESFVGIIIMLSFVYTCINTVKVITTEKEKQLKEAMKIMGLPNWLHWTAWFLKTFIFLLISVILIIILIKVSWYPNTEYSVFTHADPTVMLVFLLLYMCATITFCFAISVFFSKANTAATVAGLLWFLSYAPYLFLQDKYDQLSLTTKLLASLGSNTAMAYGFQLMLMYEGTSEGIQWSNIGRPNTPDDSLTLGYIMMVLIADSLLYLLVALYFEAVFPGEYGVPLPWYFPFTSSYWFRHPRSVTVEDFPADDLTAKGEFFEREPSYLSAGIQIKHLRKMFGKKAAVRNLSLNMYNDQITVLLGHNGAGKTTTMSMLTGMFPPTSGTATICGHDIRADMDGVRSSLGLCPQHNILFDDLTVNEHLYFFSKLKGLKSNAIRDEIKKYVVLLELEPKADEKSSTLSGGMKRKLCVGMALCGDSKVVMLDEPTAGMDPSARRALWNLLQQQKLGRTMLLTTHFMDEADLLGDRIAIMAGGELQCCGSSFFLKKKYGAGYHLIMDKSPECRPEEVTKLLTNHIPNIQVHGNVGSELTYLLVEEQTSVFEKMLQDLEHSTDSLGIRSYGISLTTLEEVFMKVGADRGQEEHYNSSQIGTNDGCWEKLVGTFKSKFAPREALESYPHNDETTIPVQNTELLSGWRLVQNQFLAMLMKKSLSVIRTWILQCIQIFMPVAFLIIAIVVSRNMNTSNDLPKLAITLDSYDDPVTLIEIEQNSTYSDSYQTILQSFKTEMTGNITSRMLQLTETVPSTVRLKYIVGATFSARSVIAWFNNNPYHSPPLALGLVLNSIFKNLVGNNKNIRFINFPLPFTADSKVQQLLQGNSMGFQLAFNIGFSMAFVSSFYLLFYVKERVCKSKHLQFVSGVKVYVFWIVAFICDIVTFIITIIAIILILICFQEDGFKSTDDLSRIFLILFYFGVAMLPMMYFASYLFQVPSTGYTRMTLFSVFTGVAAFLVVQVLSTPGIDLEYVANTLHWIFLMVPHYSLATGIRDTYTTYATNKMCNFFVQNCLQMNPNYNSDMCWELACNGNVTQTLTTYCCVREPDYYKWTSPGIGRNLLYSFTFGTTLFLLLIVMDYKIFSNVINRIIANYQNITPKPVPEEDSDVHEEKLKIRTTPERQLHKDYTLVLKDLTKYYKDFLAVNGLCLGVKSFECFGLLGVNGAGKTTTFKMITGDVKITYGDAWVKGLSVKSRIKDVQKHIGYCPQFDALLDDLTAKESLTMFALLRGVPLDDSKYVAEQLAKDFDFYRHLNKKVKELSGGNKRKLSTSISLIGDPSVIYLDEPTTGMDPATKRFLWNALCKIRDKGKCVVLTSHSMEECEALCTRLAIMVNGNFKCLGSTQHLKNKFAEGYTLTIKIKKTSSQPDLDSDSETEIVERFIEEHFPKAVQREKHEELLTYYIVDKTIPWSKMFGILETSKKQLNIEDYSIGQSSLEQVFLTFTKLQR